MESLRGRRAHEGASVSVSGQFHLARKSKRFEATLNVVTILTRALRPIQVPPEAPLGKGCPKGSTSPQIPPSKASERLSSFNGSHDCFDSVDVLLRSHSVVTGRDSDASA
ncbi:diphthamide biosynthesis protein [Pseudozyma hubeiensis SY62]|uniref:Diphthamide biosynthesis protein n=1 Tax=Pseudozyma hubeiensis (strain SY62) TaxID=1305764 RepID=R9PKY8_PSEHS|nr:diphthamide biosynthesis protein [Pseudozyma hubeiensis SY62]GAC98760.1 diphthamide biosynthesis protein [Pseudozyma hubeiensis SY62]